MDIDWLTKDGIINFQQGRKYSHCVTRLRVHFRLCREVPEDGVGVEDHVGVEVGPGDVHLQGEGGQHRADGGAGDRGGGEECWWRDVSR